MKILRTLAILAVASAPIAAGEVACSSTSRNAVDAGVERPAADSASERPTLDSGPDAPPRDGGTPSLVSLSVMGAMSALTPRFSPSIHDYYVTCAAGTSSLTVAMKASPGAESQLIEPAPKSAASPEQTLAVSVKENLAIVASATNGSEIVEYWVRCLPHDFPPIEWDLHPDAGAPVPGYYMIGTYMVPMGESGYAIVLDRNGVPVWYYLQPNGTGVDNVDTVVDGAISFDPFPKPFPYEIHQLSPPMTSYLHALALDQHELRALEGGNFVVLTNPHLSGVDLHTVKIPLSDGGAMTFDSNADIQDCHVVELTPGGSIAWDWIASQHFDPAAVTTLPEASKEVPLPDGGTVVDTFHCNSIDVDEPSGNLLVSARNADSIFYIEKSTKKVLWKIGGANTSKDNATYVPVGAADAFYRQHDARLQPSWKSSCAGGTGQISVFDDETLKAKPGRAIVYDVTIALGDGGSPADCGAPSPDGGSRVTSAWQFAGSGPSTCCGSFRILPDGSRTIGWGNTAANSLVFTEVDDKGNDLLDFRFTVPNTSYRSVKVPLGALDLNAMRLGAGLP